MNIALDNLFPIFIAFIFGFNFKKIYGCLNITVIEKMSNLCLYFLLILMGVTIGLIPDIFYKLNLVGLSAISIAVGSSLSIAVVLAVFHIKVNRSNGNEVNLHLPEEKSFNVISYIKDPLQLGMLVIIGFVLGNCNFIPGYDYGAIISALLYFLIFVIAIKLSYSGLELKTVFFNKQNIIMTMCTVLASYLGAAFISLFIPLSLTQSLAVSSGFGWYTLSGILITKMGDPLLGSVAFLCDLFREVIALLLIPTLSRLGNGNIAIGVAGATAMDVTLPIIEKHCGVSYVPVALLSGGIITIIVPFLIPFFFSL